MARHMVQYLQYLHQLDPEDLPLNGFLNVIIICE